MKKMTLNAWLRLIAGFFVMASVALGYFVSHYFYYFNAFGGLKLLQTAFICRCQMMALLRLAGVPED